MPQRKTKPTTPLRTARSFEPRSESNPGGVLFRDFTLTVRAPAEGDTDERLSVAISSEAPVERYDWYSDEWYSEVLDHSPGGVDFSYARDGLPFCLDHNLRTQVGLLEDVTLDEDRVIRGRLRQGNHPDAAWVFADLRDSVRQKVSIGYWPGETYTVTQDNKNELPVRRYTGWLLYEASSVAVPADYSVGVGRSVSGRVADSGTEPGKRRAQAQERNVEPDEIENTPAPGSDAAKGAAARAAARNAETAALAALATNFPEHSRLAEWIAQDVSLDAARDEVMRKLAAAAATRTTVSTATQQPVTTHNRAEDEPWDATQPGEFLRAVISAGRNGPLDPRLAATRSQNTLSGEDGGFAVPPGVTNTLLEAAVTGSDILARVTTRPITTGNNYTEVTARQGDRTNGKRNAGIQGYWVNEGGTYTRSQAKLDKIDLKIQKLGVICPVTDEQIDDGPALVSYLNEQVPEEIRFTAEDAIWEGDGVGKPIGFMNSAAPVTVPIEATQTVANTSKFIWLNCANMFGAMPARRLRRAVWYINQKLYSKILTATAGSGGNAVPMFAAPGQLASAPAGAIYGLPIIPVEYASAEGTPGDIVFADVSDYLFITKGGIRNANSMHVLFESDQQLLKFTWRVNGGVRTPAPLTPFKGTPNSLSPYVILDARS